MTWKQGTWDITAIHSGGAIYRDKHFQCHLWSGVDWRIGMAVSNDQETFFTDQLAYALLRGHGLVAQ